MTSNIHMKEDQKKRFPCPSESAGKTIKTPINLNREATKVQWNRH